MSSISVDSAVIQKLIKHCSDTITQLEKTRQGLLTQYRSLALDWSDSKYKYLETVIEECSSAINKVSVELQDCVHKLERINVHIREYENVNLGGANLGTDASLIAGVLNSRSEQVNYWNEQLDAISDRIRAYNTQHFSQYISAERINKPLNTCLSFDAPGSQRLYGMDENTLGFNNGKYSHVFVGTTHELQTIVHENLHQLSANDSSFRLRRGIIENRNNSRQNVQMNEAITEMLTRETLGSDYGEDYSAYSNNRDAMARISNIMGHNIVCEAYFQNRPELMRDQFESVMGEGSWEQLSELFDDSLRSDLPHTQSSAIIRRDNLIDEYYHLSNASTSQNALERDI